ncbi:TolC family protein [Steroidobacter sp. S1-65]|uniref:TolC family protein n=1 Tax=Steroidobacter gossypii TaxID=2805490 RepID=A0ABS1WWX6_9GAMM|nr:TolC family protein [Steroidobacter gossypii]MBM0105462.1 TolC family protein [Steroidobacter gossypii]
MRTSMAPAWRAGVVVCALGWMIGAHGAASRAQNELTLEQALTLAAERNPQIRSFKLEAESLAGRSEFEALGPAWSVQTEFENFGGTGELSGIDALESTVQLSRVFERGGKSSLRRELGARQIDALAADHQVRSGDLLAEVARRFIHVVSDQQALLTARRATALARTTRDVVKQRVQAGASSPAMLSKAEIALARAGIEEEHAEHELASSRVSLAVLWGDASASFGTAAGNLFDLPAIEPLEAYAQRLESSPELSRFASEARAQDARIQLAEAGRAADVSVAAGVRRLESFDDHALIASFSVPLGTRQRAALHEKSARAERARIDAEREARQLDAQAKLFQLYQEISHARTEAQALHTNIRPQAEAMLATTDQGYRAGRFSLLELADAQAQLLEIERQAIEAAAQFHTLLIEIRRVTGAPVRAFERSAP